MFGSNKPGGVILHDDLDKINPSPNRTIKRDWREDIPRYIFLSFLILIYFILFLLSFQWINSYDISVMYVGWFIIIIALLALAIISIGSLTVFLYGMSLEARRKTLINVLEHQTTINAMQNLTDQFFNVATERMKHSHFMGVQNLTYSPTNTRNEIPHEETVLNENVPIIEAELPILEDMQSSGLIGRSGNSILLGFSKDD